VVVAAVLAVALGIQLLLDVAGVGAGLRSGRWVLGLVTGVVLAGLALLGPRSPVRSAAAALALAGAAAIAGDAWRLPSQPGLAGTVALLVLGAAAVRVAGPRAAGLLGLAGAVVLTVGRSAATRSQDVLPLALASLVAWGLALAVGTWLRLDDARRRQELDDVRREERLELARELHDVVAHHVAGIVVQAQAALVVAETRPEMVPTALSDIEAAGTDALAAMRRVVGILRENDDAAPVTAGPEQLAELVSRFAAHGPSVVAHLPDAPSPAWPPEVATTVYRVVQEALTNVALHAPHASTVTLTVEDGPSQVRAIITDDAGGAAAPRPTTSGGHGLVGLRERVEALGGRFEAGYGEDNRWTVRATLPHPAVAR